MGALTDNTGASDIALMQQAQYAQQQNEPSPDTGGALSSPDYQGNAAIDSQGNAGVVSPQDLRTLQLLDNVRGQLAPKHTGNAWAEGYGQVAEDQYKTLSAAIAANSKAKAALMLQAQKNKGTKSVAETQVGGKLGAAEITAGGKREQLLTQEEMDDMGLPPGTTAAVNPFGKVRVVHAPPPGQSMMTGTDPVTHKPTYADPGQALTPQSRSDHQKFIKLASPLMSQLDDQNPDSLVTHLNDPNSASALGGPGLAERTAQGLVGFAGQDTNVAPKDLELRTQIKQFNQKAATLLKSIPSSQNLTPKVMQELEESLPDPDSMFESRASAMEKMKRFKTNISEYLQASQDALRGKAPITSNATSQDDEGTPPPASSFTPEQARAELARRKAAKGGN